MANRYMKRCSTSLTIRELQIKTIMRYHLTSIRMAIFKKKRNSNGQKGHREKETLVQYWWEGQLVQPLRKTIQRFLKKLKIELLGLPW